MNKIFELCYHGYTRLNMTAHDKSKHLTLEDNSHLFAKFDDKKFQFTAEFERVDGDNNIHWFLTTYIEEVTESAALSRMDHFCPKIYQPEYEFDVKQITKLSEVKRRFQTFVPINGGCSLEKYFEHNVYIDFCGKKVVLKCDLNKNWLCSTDTIENYFDRMLNQTIFSYVQPNVWKMHNPDLGVYASGYKLEDVLPAFELNFGNIIPNKQK